MKLVAHGRVDGPCLSPSIKVWGKGKNVEQYREELRKADPRTAELLRNRRLSVRIDFHLKGSRLQLSDLDNLAKTVLDGLFGTFGKKGSSPFDRFVWRLEIAKIVATEGEFTEFWIFDEGTVN